MTEHCWGPLTPCIRTWVEFLRRLNSQNADRKPGRTSPIGVSDYATSIEIPIKVLQGKIPTRVVKR
jgi:hypothetical protein